MTERSREGGTIAGMFELKENENTKEMQISLVNRILYSMFSLLCHRNSDLCMIQQILCLTLDFAEVNFEKRAYVTFFAVVQSVSFRESIALKIMK